MIFTLPVALILNFKSFIAEPAEYSLLVGLTSIFNDASPEISFRLLKSSAIAASSVVSASAFRVASPLVKIR